MSAYQQLCASLLLIAIVSQTQAVQFHSGPQQTILLELYTSEGCSSCPPAEAYLNQLKADERLWQDIVPLAFHVDYWDYLGWQDRFAKPEHRDRQERYAAVNRQSTIYTPAFFLNGKPWRRGLFGRDPNTEDRETGVLSVNYQGGQITAGFKSYDEPRPLRLHVAVLGLGFQSSIKAGENRGRESAHEFVVLEAYSAVSSEGQWQLTVDKKALLPASRYALAAWVTLEDDPRPIQATGGFLPQLD